MNHLKCVWTKMYSERVLYITIVILLCFQRSSITMSVACDMVVFCFDIEHMWAELTKQEEKSRRNAAIVQCSCNVLRAVSLVHLFLFYFFLPSLSLSHTLPLFYLNNWMTLFRKQCKRQRNKWNIEWMRVKFACIDGRLLMCICVSKLKWNGGENFP